MRDVGLDPIAAARSLEEHLSKRHRATDARRIIDAIDGGSTGTEILMALRWTVRELLGGGGLTSAEETLAREIIAMIDAAGV